MWKLIPRLGLILLSGLVMGLAPAPVSAWPLAWIALVPLWESILHQSRPSRKRYGQTLLLALCWGLGYHGLALSWVTHLHPLTWMGIPWFTSLVIVIACWLFIAFWGAAMVMIWAALVQWLWAKTPTERRRFEPKRTDPSDRRRSSLFSALLRVLLGTVIWSSLEGLWSLGPLYWTSLSYTQSPYNLVILHLGQLSGPFTVTAAIVAVNGLLAEAWFAWQSAKTLGTQSATPRSTAPSRSPVTTLLCTALGLWITAHGLGWILYSRPLVNTPESALRVGMIQGNIPNRIKLAAQGLRLAQQRYTQGYEALVAQNVDVVLTPEGALPLLWRDSAQNQSPLYSAIAQKQVPVWLGTFGVVSNLTDTGGFNPKITQSLLTLTGAARDPYSRYNKIKLVPLGEYIPFESVLGPVINRLSSIEFSMVKGDFDQRFDTPFGRAVVGICYESAFANWFRMQTADGGQFILTASNNDPYPHAMMMQHHAQDVMRAIESDRWAVRSTNTGYSGIVNPRGQTMWMSQRNQYEVYAGTIHRRQTKTLYVRWGNWLIPVLFLGVGGIWAYEFMQSLRER